MTKISKDESVQPNLEQVLQSGGDHQEIPTGFSSPKEIDQADQIRSLQQQLAQAATSIGQITKKMGIKNTYEEETGDFFGFLRALEGDPVISWKTVPGSYVALNQFDQIDDKQFITVTTLSGKTEKMHYTEFDQRTKVSQIPCKILGYGYKNNVGEWRPKHLKPEDNLKIILSDDNGTTYAGKELTIQQCFIN